MGTVIDGDVGSMSLRNVRICLNSPHGVKTQKNNTYKYNGKVFGSTGPKFLGYRTDIDYIRLQSL
jgi:hypothetical protein